jgi:adenylosuccinate lyase
VSTVDELCRFAGEYSGMPALAYTHFQAAQPTTVGKRATLWINDLLMDLEQLEFQLSNLSLLGCKGTTVPAPVFWSFSEATRQSAWSWRKNR